MANIEIGNDNSGIVNSGDNNTITQNSTTTQNHSGGGDNVAGDKVINISHDQGGIDKKHFLTMGNITIVVLGLIVVVAITLLANQKSDGISDSFNGVSGSTIIIKDK